MIKPDARPEGQKWEQFRKLCIIREIERLSVEAKALPSMNVSEAALPCHCKTKLAVQADTALEHRNGMRRNSDWL